MDLIQATYIATRPDRDPELLAENIAREQTLEILPELIPEAIARRFLGRVIQVEALCEQRWALTIAYPIECASGQIGQLMHLLYGNVSFYPRIRLTGLELPNSLLEQFPGPLAGIAGIRRHIDVADRALLMTVLKPRGSSPEMLADLAGRFARGGGDILKDDQNMVDQAIEAFRRRVGACARAIDDAAQATGRRCLYLPHVAGSGMHLHLQLEILTELNLPGVVLCPWFMGLETAATAARDHGLMWLAHPAGAGVYTGTDNMGISPDLVFGTLPRLAGADLVIYPGSGGRLSAGTGDDDSQIGSKLTEPLGGLRPVLPCTGGGKTLAQAPDLAGRHGPDLGIVVGGDLLKTGKKLEQVVRQAVARLK